MHVVHPAINLVHPLNVVKDLVTAWKGEIPRIAQNDIMKNLIAVLINTRRLKPAATDRGTCHGNTGR